MKTRVIVAKMLAVGTGAVALVSHHVYAEESIMDFLLEVSGYSLLVIAAVGRIWSSIFIIGKKTKTLVTDGPYSMVRNPLYFFSLLGFLGIGLAFESLVLAAAFGCVFFLTHWPTILSEEKRLAAAFGAPFEDYRKLVPRFLPKPWRLNFPASVTFSPRVFSRALLDTSLVLGAFLAAHTVEWAHSHEIIPVLVRLY